MTQCIEEAARILEDILGEADALIRQRQKDRGFEFPHLVVAVTPDGQVVLRGNVSPDGLRSFSEDLKNVADELTAPPGLGDTTHRSIDGCFGPDADRSGIRSTPARASYSRRVRATQSATAYT